MLGTILRLVMALMAMSVCVGQTYGKEVLRWKGSLLLDYDQFDPAYQRASTEDEGHFELRRAKLSLSYDPSPRWRGRLQLTASNMVARDDGIKVADAWVRWRNSNKEWHVFLGRLKEPLGHERLMGTSNLPVIERSMVSTAFTPGRSAGGMVQWQGKNATFSSGFFQSDPEEDQIDNEKVMAWTSRYTLSKSFENQHRWHLGVGLSYRDLDESLFQLEERAEVNSADNVVFSGRYFADQQITSQLELGVQWHDVWLMGEYFDSQVDAVDGDLWHYSGFYLQLVYGGEAAYKNGHFKRPKKRKGLWQGVVRYSGLDLRDNELGTEADSLTLGVNYYFSKQWTVMLNHLVLNLSGNVVNTETSGNATSARLKYKF